MPLTRRDVICAALLGSAGLAVVLGHTRFAPALHLAWLGFTSPGSIALWLLANLAFLAFWWRGRGRARPTADERPRGRLSRRRRASFIAGTQAIVVAIAALAFEAIAERPIDIPRGQAVFIEDPGVQLLAPRLDVLVRYRERRAQGGFELRSYRVRTDEDGCRVATSPTPARAAQGALAIAGDSFAFGQHVEYDRSLAGVIGQALPSTRVVNVAVSGTCSEEYGRTLGYQLARKRLRVDRVVVGLFVDMQIGDIPRCLARRRFGPYRVIDGYTVGSQRHAELVASRWRRWTFGVERRLRSSSALYNVVSPATADPEFAVSALGHFGPDDAAQYRALVVDNVERVRAAAEVGPDAVTAVLIPSYLELEFAQSPQRYDAEHATFFRASMALWDDIGAALRARGHRVCDGRAAVRDPAMFTVDTHLNARGHSALGAAVIETLR